LDIDPKLQEYLGKFRRLEDFRVDVSKSFSFSLLVVLKENCFRNQGAWDLVLAVSLAQGPLTGPPPFPVWAFSS
jgi:hypothetical protein